MVIIFLAEGFEESEALCPLDMLRRAGICAKTVSITDSLTVTGSHGLTVFADMTVNDLNKVSDAVKMVVLPGGMPGTKNLEHSKAVRDFVLSVYNAGGFVAAICAAPYILAQLGILKGKNATCYPDYRSELYESNYLDQDAVRDGNVITGRAAGAAFEFGIELARALCDEETLDKLLSGMIY